MKQDYFERREPAAPVDYEEAYWGTIVDPDGSVRNRLEEREKHLEDVKQELTFLQSLPAGRLLDLGCGLGFLLSGLGPEWEKHGVEVSRFAAEHARQWATIYVGELAEVAYPDEYFDVVVMHHVIEHMEDPRGHPRGAADSEARRHRAPWHPRFRQRMRPAFWGELSTPPRQYAY